MEQPPVRMPGSLPIGPLTSMDDLRRKARSLPTRIVVIAAAQDDVALEAAAVAEEEGLARCVLVGDQHRIEALLWDLGRDPADFQIINRQELHEAVGTAVRLVREGQGHILMKGKVTSADLMKEVLHRESGLRRLVKKERRKKGVEDEDRQGHEHYRRRSGFPDPGGPPGCPKTHVG